MKTVFYYLCVSMCYNCRDKKLSNDNFRMALYLEILLFSQYFLHLYFWGAGVSMKATHLLTYMLPLDTLLHVLFLFLFKY